MRTMMAVVLLAGIGAAPAVMAEEPREPSAEPVEFMETAIDAPADAPREPAPALTPEVLIGGNAPEPSPTALEALSPSLTMPDAAVSPDEAPPLKTEGDVRALCERFLQHIIDGQFDAAFGLLRPYVPISQSKYTTLEAETKAQLDLAEEHFGSPIGSVLINTQNLDNTALKFRFLQKFEYDVLYWDFIFYKPHEHWLFNGIGFDDEIQGVFR